MPSRPVLIGRGLVLQTLNQNHKNTHHYVCARVHTYPHHDTTPTGAWCRPQDKTPTPTPDIRAPGRVHRVTAAIATGKHPDPYRTRKLSLPAPMVLQPRGCGRVGRRRTYTAWRPPSWVASTSYFAPLRAPSIHLKE